MQVLRHYCEETWEGYLQAGAKQEREAMLWETKVLGSSFL